ncbi:uncharacterized protein LOC129224900 [Uloborus diversus]|uniref:uncharacterized protein LOC129224900 n=1 Tax=Uloborus diversus TaxID=327109 RepID=UPI00240A03AE|nr:uncharacterized protein LOC129224900 [Uloborus diversus]
MFIIAVICERKSNPELRLMIADAIGSDRTAVITGVKGGVIRLLVLHLKRPLQWLICQLHANELPLRYLLRHLDGSTTDPPLTKHIPNAELEKVAETGDVIEKCGKSTQGRIIGGELANINDYPWLLAMHVGDAEKGFRFSCGASLIHPKWVVTAGHCVQNVPKNGYAKDGQCYTESHEVAPCFYLGDQIKLALSRTQGEILEIPVAKVIPNPQFEPNASPYHHDIALLQLRKTLSCNKFVSPVCVSEGQYMDYPNRPVFLAGWGKTDNSQNGKTPVLKQTPLVVKLHEECYENTKLESVLCATGYPFGSTPMPECGKPISTESLVIGGSVANVTDYPWLLGLLVQDIGVERGLFKCGASLIHPQWAITAAHCIKNFPDKGIFNKGKCYDKNFKAVPCFYRANETSLAFSRSQGESPEIGVSRVIPYPKYNPKRSSYDLALLRLKKPVKCTKAVNLVCVTEGERMDYPKNFAITAGWGRTDPNILIHLCSKFTGEHLYSCSSLYDIHNCDDFRALTPFVATSLLYWTARRLMFERTMVGGDSGGPLMYSDGRLCYITGLLSRGDLQCGITSKAFFTKISDFLSWIHRYVPLNEVRKATQRKLRIRKKNRNE